MYIKYLTQFFSKRAHRSLTSCPALRDTALPFITCLDAFLLSDFRNPRSNLPLYDPPLACLSPSFYIPWNNEPEYTFHRSC